MAQPTKAQREYAVARVRQILSRKRKIRLREYEKAEIARIKKTYKRDIAAAQKAMDAYNAIIKELPPRSGWHYSVENDVARPLPGKGWETFHGNVETFFIRAYFIVPELEDDLTDFEDRIMLGDAEEILKILKEVEGSV